MGNYSTTGSVGFVREAHRFDEDALRNYLADHLPDVGPSLHIMQFEGGQSNPTFMIDTGHARYVMRKKPPGKLLASAHLVEREFQVMRALSKTGVPVPKTHVLCEDVAIIGTPFFVMDYVEGRILRDASLPSIPNGDRAAIYTAAIDTLAALHNVDFAAVGLASFGKPEQYVARQIARWTKQYEATKTEPLDAMEFLAKWLPANLPTEIAPTIIHGDFRIDNLVFHPTEPRVLAVLDWELSTLGDPLSDVAYHCLPYHLPSQVKALRGLLGVDTKALGIPAENAIVAAYCARTGRETIGTWGYYLAFSLFRLASIAQGVLSRSLQGNASSSNASEIGAMAKELARAGREIAERA